MFPGRKPLTDQRVLLDLERATLEQQMVALQLHSDFRDALFQQEDWPTYKDAVPWSFETLRRKQDALAKQRKFCSAIHHALDEFELVHFPFNQAIVLDQGEPGYY